VIETLDLKFTGSYPRLEDCPAPNHPEYAFIGRSNVGKSSLINLISGRKHIAKVSGTPGKTQLLNFFWVEEGWYIVDLPGYGFAKVSKTMRVKWEAMLRNYLVRRDNLQCVFLLIDSSITPQEADMKFAAWLGECHIPFVLVFTKIDRTSKPKRMLLREKWEERFLQEWDALPQTFDTSSSKFIGQDDLLSFIRKTNKAIIK
jgi:GTP-binding protein